MPDQPPFSKPTTGVPGHPEGSTGPVAYGQYVEPTPVRSTANVTDPYQLYSNVKRELPPDEGGPLTPEDERQYGSTQQRSIYNEQPKLSVDQDKPVPGDVL